MNDSHHAYWVIRRPLIQVIASPDPPERHTSGWWRVVALNEVMVPFELYVDGEGYVSRLTDGQLKCETKSSLPHDEVQVTVGTRIFLLPTPVPIASIQVLMPETYEELVNGDDAHHPNAF
jgi:hypothetical protein